MVLPRKCSKDGHRVLVDGEDMVEGHTLEEVVSYVTVAICSGSMVISKY